MKQNMLCVKRGKRSTLWVDRSQNVFMRQYHDTGDWHAVPEPPKQTVSMGKRAMDGALPKYLHVVRHILCEQRPRDVYEFRILYPAQIRETTAWSYVTTAVELFPEVRPFATPLVYEPLWRVVCELAKDDGGLAGRLTDLLPRVDHALRTDARWTTVPNRLAHVRLARVCVS